MHSGIQECDMAAIITVQFIAWYKAAIQQLQLQCIVTYRSVIVQLSLLCSAYTDI